MTYPEQQGDYSAASAEKTHPPAALRRTAVKNWTATGPTATCILVSEGADRLDTTLICLIGLVGFVSIGAWMLFEVGQGLRQLFLFDEG